MSAIGTNKEDSFYSNSVDHTARGKGSFYSNSVDHSARGKGSLYSNSVDHTARGKDPDKPADRSASQDTRKTKIDFTSASTSTYHTEEPRKSTVPQTYGLFNMIVNHYWLVFSVVFAIELLGVFLSYLFILQNPDKKLFPLEFKGVPIELKTDSTFRRLMAFKIFQRHPSILQPEEEKIYYLPSTKPASSLSVIYKGDNVLTKECLEAIRDVEEWLSSSDLWTNVSLTDINEVPLKPKSVIRYFDGTYGKNLNDLKFSNISRTLYAVYTNKNMREDVEKLISIDAVVSATEVKSTVTRSIFTIGQAEYPGLGKQTFWEYSFANKLDELVLHGRAGMKIYYFNHDMMISALKNQVEKDISLAYGSFAFILIFVCLQTQSIFITLFGIMSIVFSFIWTNYIYRVILNHSYFGIFHAMSIFIILGIGTDDLFVFYDMWRTTACMDLHSDERRFAICYRHASMSMLITSVTTAVAFVSNAFTPLYGIYSFAVFTAILVVINYVSAVLFFPLCVLVYHNTLAWLPWPWDYFYPASAADQKKQMQPNLVVRFFKGPFHSVVTHRLMKWIFILCSTGNVVFFAVLASELEISEKNVQFYRNGYNYQEASKLEDYGFKRRLLDPHLTIHIVFGVKEQDMSQCDFHDYKCKGIFNYDDALDLNPIPAQLALLKSCHMLKNLDGHDDLHLVRDSKTNQVEVRCFLDNMNQFFTKHGLDSNIFKPPVNLSLPVSGIKFLQITRLRPDLYDVDIASGNFYRFFETAASYWLTNAYRGDYEKGSNFTSDVHFSKLMGFTFSEDTAQIVSRGNDYYGNRLRYFNILINTSMENGRTDYKTGLAAYHAWENFTTSWMSLMPSAVQGFQTTRSDAWHRFKMSEELQKSAVRGIIIGTVLAFGVLTLATCNIIISLLATLNILLVIVTFAGCLKLLDMKISVVESINLSLVAGLSVDYVVHLSESYNHAPHTERQRKVRDMLEQMGVSILSGSITTSGAAFFMLQAAVYFFFQFGFFIMLTIFLSLMYSLFWFTPMLSVVGPQGNVGSLVPVFRWIKKILKPITAELTEVDKEHKNISYSRSANLSIKK